MRSRARYIDEFLRLKCAPELIKYFPNGKEITESFGAYNAIREYKLAAFNDDSMTIVCVGDGTSPRTGAVCAYRSKWNVISIDPNFRKDTYFVDRLTSYKAKMEQLSFYFDKVIILAVHSHAPLIEVLKRIQSPQRSLVAIPCCVPYEFPGDIQYEDKSIWSPKNQVKIWKNI